jgi:oxygen-independent coproporphyrinogen-3 oxidase
VSRLATPPLALYIHLPWCVAKCPYCDFNSHVHTGVLPERQYVAALLADLETDLERVPGRSVETVFIGGGTPSLFDPSSIAALLEGVRERVAVAPGAEVTLEANPGTVEHGHFAGYRDAGVNRVSLGAQSFGARQLALLGRIHEAADTVRSVVELDAAGLGNFNLDLMYALPEQGVDGAVDDLERALALGPRHLSHYQLSLEPGTVFYTRPPPLPDEDLAAEIEAATHARLADAGFVRYEISAWSRPGDECRHNLNYWNFGDYLGIGAGAHGKLTDAVTDRILRTEKHKQPREYLERSAAGALLGPIAPVPPSARPFEYLLNALRLVRGFSGAHFEAATGLPITVIDAPLATAFGRGLLAPTADGWQPTPLGLRFLNDLQGLFLASG